MDKYVICWMRRDMRLHDNHALYQALTSGFTVQPIFIFDKNILSELPSNDARVTFIHDELTRLKKECAKWGSDVKVYYGNPLDVYRDLLHSDRVHALYYNHDYEPYARDRDYDVNALCHERGIEVHSFKDHVIFEKDEIVKGDGGPYTVFTPYKKRWLARRDDVGIPHYPSEKHLSHLRTVEAEDIISLSEMGFERSDISMPDRSVAQSVIKQYAERRNFPALENGTSRLGIHFRFGTISIREKAKKAAQLNDTYLSELIWRDFYSQILHHFPHVVSDAFRAKYDKVEWRDAPDDFKKWCAGKTGYPIVDAGIRELNATGYMHNRVRMITASFLTKHLLINWRWGEAYFAEKLLDFDLASNNGGWQWASGSGTDAAPYFRIFNPTTQLTKFDKELKYVKKWVPEYGTSAYPAPMVDHKEARERCLATYKAALQ